jgi:hypothetical protein
MGGRFVSVEDPPGYFRVRSTGTIHLVRRVSGDRLVGGALDRGVVTYWCDTLDSLTRGTLSDRRPYEGTDCARCVTSTARRRARSRGGRAGA